MPLAKQIIKILILIILAIAFSSISLFMLKDKIALKAKQISDRRAMAIALDKRENNLIALKDNYNIVNDNISKTRSFFPEIDDMDAFIDGIDKISAELGGIGTVKFENHADIFGQNTRKLDFTLVFSGRKEFFSKFISQMKNMHYFIEINRIEMKYSRDTAISPDLMTINASTFIKI